MSLCQYHIVLITTALKYNLKSGIVMPTALLFFSKVDLAVQGCLFVCLFVCGSIQILGLFVLASGIFIGKMPVVF